MNFINFKDLNSDSSNSDDMETINKILENEKKQNKKETWSKLNKINKLLKLDDFVVNYAKEHKLNEKMVKQLKLLLYDAIEKKKLNRVRDITYDKTKGIITNIPILIFNKTTKLFTLNSDKKVSTLRALAPIRNTKTKKAGKDKKNMNTEEKN